MNFALIGMGRSGQAALRFLLRQGHPRDQIATFDEKSGNADFSQADLLMNDFKPDVFVVSPGYPLSTPWLTTARKAGIQVTSEIGLSCEFLAEEKIIGVTGSVGKSTTVAILGEGARSFDPNAFVGGNFGIPLCDYMSDVLEGKVARAKWLILELSSFQLENCDPLRLDLAAITSFTANHLERYRDLEEYYLVKWSLINRTRGTVFLNARGGDLAKWASLYPGKATMVDRNDPSLFQFHLKESALIGMHNQDNLAVAAALATAAHWPSSSIDAMKSFRGLSHRLENLGTIGGVHFINDSKATAMDSVLTAVQSCLEFSSASSQVLLLLGGKDKNLPWEQLSVLKKNARIKTVFFGQCAKMAAEKSGLSGPQYPTLEKAVHAVVKEARTDDTVLLSPGGTSLDEFKNFEERGNFFRQLVTQHESSKH